MRVAKIGKNWPHKKNQYFLEKLTNLDKYFNLDISNDYLIFNNL